MVAVRKDIAARRGGGERLMRKTTTPGCNHAAESSRKRQTLPDATLKAAFWKRPPRT